MQLQWQHWTQRTRSMEGLDDVVRYDLSHFCRKMEPATETFYRYVQANVCWDLPAHRQHTLGYWLTSCSHGHMRCASDSLAAA